MVTLIRGIFKRVHGLTQKKSIWSLTDQGIVSLGNFLTNILLARNLPPSDYGIYLLIYGVQIFLTNGIHGYIITYPISVKGSVVERSQLSIIATNYLVLTVFLAVPFSMAIFGGVFAATGKFELAPLALLAMFCSQIQETVRRSLMSHLLHSQAVWGDGLSYLGQALSVSLLVQGGFLSIKTTFVVLALTSLLAAVIQAFQLKLKPIVWSEVWNSAKIGWNLGKWYLLSNLISIVNIQATPWILAIFHGIETTATVQAVVNILGISNPVIFSMVGLTVPAVAKANLDSGFKGAWQIAVKYGIQYGVILLPLYTIMLCFPRKVLEIIYGQNSPYLNLETVLRIFVFVYLLMYLSQIPAAVLAGLEKSKYAFTGQLGSTIISMLIGIPLIIKIGVLGTALANVVTNMSRILIYFFQLRRLKISMSSNTTIR